ncbi:MAG: hypothetical protein V4598_17990 [Bdellovibrionota bacterium]
MFSRIVILLLLSSCTLLKGSEKLKSSDLLKNLEAIKVEGEGKGRLHIQERQYLFGVESLLKEDKSWIMGVSIPLHGEEVLLFPSLDQKNTDDYAMDSFALRIDAGIRENLKKSTLKGADFLTALRKTLRFLLAARLKLPVNCEAKDKDQICKLGDDEFLVKTSEKSLQVVTPFAGHSLVTTGTNLTGPIFMNTQFKVTSPETTQDLLTLELFWK